MSAPGPEHYVAYYGVAYLKDAIDSHKTGMRVKFTLKEEQDYESFKLFKKRRKGKAGSGQYRVFMRHINDEKWVAQHMDMLFVGWTVSSANGCVVTFEMKDRQQWRQFRKANALDGGYTMESLPALEVMMVELDDNGAPIDVKQREKLEKMRDRKKWPKGGAHSKRAAILCNDKDFLSFLVQTKRLPPGDKTPAEVADWMRKEARLDSRAQLDHDPIALHRYEEKVHKPFIRWYS